MVFSSTVFLFAFLPVTLILYFNPFCKGTKYKNIMLLLMSLAFYAWGEPVFVFVMIISVFVNWIMGNMIERHGDKKRLFAAMATVYNVLLLIIFKYLTFITKNIAWLSGNKSIAVNIALPIGISFFTFQMMSYIFDVTSGKTVVQHSFWKLLLYISMFPQLIAGPIVRYETIAGELDKRKADFDEFSNGMCRFLKGLMKKVLLANNIGILADTVFDYDSGQMSTLTAWLGAVAYTLQIYYDFSGYSDMAIGIGKMFGFHFPENFNRPYSAGSISEFWRRWHISMGTWFRDYVYIPLGGSRTKLSRQIFNLFAVWILTGLWHGAGWTFVLWGIMYFVLISVEKLTKFQKRNVPFRHFYTMLFVIIGWVLFRSDSITEAGSFLLAMVGIGGNGIADSSSAALLGQFGIILAVASVLSVIRIKSFSSRRSFQVVTGALYLIGFAVTVTFIVKGGYNPFIYFNF
ncbi:MAG: hypothetical protein NC417_13785 [Candidatus Gastranaerophilales bacterium]|nr:hypothetical protein [Candidatus Gastranaerophilales bacterium]